MTTQDNNTELAASIASIDTPEFLALMRNYYDTASSFMGSSPSKNALQKVIAHINQHAEAACEAGRQEVMEQAIDTAHQIIKDGRDGLRERAEKAEALLAAQPVDLSGLRRFGAGESDPDVRERATGEFVLLDDVQALLAQGGQQATTATAEGLPALPAMALTVADELGRGHYYSADQMYAHYRKGREEGLEEAEKACAQAREKLGPIKPNEFAVNFLRQGTQRCIAAINTLKTKG